MIAHNKWINQSLVNEVVIDRFVCIVYLTVSKNNALYGLFANLSIKGI